MTSDNIPLEKTLILTKIYNAYRLWTKCFLEGNKAMHYFWVKHCYRGNVSSFPKRF